MLNPKSPADYAKAIAYISCPTTIRQRVLEHYDRAPSIEEIRRYQEVRRARMQMPDYSERTKEGTGNDRRHFQPTQPPKPPGLPTPSHKLLEMVVTRMDINMKAVLGAGRTAPYVQARSIVVKILRDRNPKLWSYTRLAALIGRTDHSTTRNLYENFNKIVLRDEKAAAVYRELLAA